MQAPPPIVPNVDVDVDVVGVAEAMMMSMVAHTSLLLVAIELVGKTPSANYFTHPMTVGA
jgi:hypothetical protein